MAAFIHFLNSIRSRSREGDEPAEFRRPRIGLALSSGGAKGLAHIGVIQVLEENGIEVDAVIGTSMGAYVGGLWSSGLNGQDLEELAATMATPRDLWALVDPLFPPRRGFIGGAKVHARLERSLGKQSFNELEKPFFAVATERESLERVVFHDGEVASAITASLAVPGIVVPVTRDGIEYIDGGVCDPLPVNYLKEADVVDKVIAINVLPPVGSLSRPQSPKSHLPAWRRILRWLNRHFNYFAAGNLLDVLRSAAMGSQMRLVDRSACKADVLIRAINHRSRWHDYNNYRHYIEIGRLAAEEALPAIRALYHEEDVSPPRETIYGNGKEMSCV